MPWLSPSYRGPVTVMGVGTSFAFVGAIPVAITISMGMKTSATVIGMGFIGFGVMLILPGLCWCLMVKRRSNHYYEDTHSEHEESLRNVLRYEDASKQPDV